MKKSKLIYTTKKGQRVTLTGKNLHDVKSAGGSLFYHDPNVLTVLVTAPDGLVHLQLAKDQNGRTLQEKTVSIASELARG